MTTVALCIASRGRPEKLLKAIKAADQWAAVHASTIISVALDDDDHTIPEKPETRCQLVWNIGPREDTLGAKYNRAAEAPADIHALWVDDVLMNTIGWDAKLAEAYEALPDDKVGLIYFGGMNGGLPNFCAPTINWQREVGFFMPPYFPTWWHETWLDEIGKLTGRTIWADIQLSHISQNNKTISLREPAFWAKVFDDLRPIRAGAAYNILSKYDSKFQRAHVLQEWGHIIHFLEERNALLRDPSKQKLFEAMGEQNPEDERYLRAKSAALALVERVNASQKASA